MMKFILGTKIEMTQVYKGDVAVPVTRVKMLPGVVMQSKTVKTDGYTAVVIGFGERRPKNINKPQLGAMKGLGNFRYVKEFRAKTAEDVAEQAQIVRGNALDFSTFEVGDFVNVVGTSKGKGFQGGVKRHRFHGHDTTHGTKDQVRMPGSIGAGEPQHVFKGMRMAGHLGDERVTVTNLEIIAIDAAASELFIKGALPGARNGVLYISGKGAMKVTEAALPKVEPVVETPTVEDVAPVELAETPVVEEVKVPARPAGGEAPVVAEVKVEEVAAPVAEVKEEVKVEAPRAEEAKVEAPKEEVVLDHATKFKALPAEEQAKFSSEAVMAIVSKLEEEYKTDLVPVVMKLAVKELTVEGLVAYFTETAKIEAAKAEELAKAIKEQILK